MKIIYDTIMNCFSVYFYKILKIIYESNLYFIHFLISFYIDISIYHDNCLCNKRAIKFFIQTIPKYVS